MTAKSAAQDRDWVSLLRPLEAELRAVRRVVTHADCPDGIASAMLLHEAIPSASIEFVAYASPEREHLAATPGMLFCDMTPPAERNQEFIDAGAIVLDHHKGAEQQVRAFGARGIIADEKLDPGVSGAVLACHVLTLLRGRPSFTVRRFARLAGIRDTWQRDDPDWEAACDQAEALLVYGAGYLLQYRTSELWPVDHEIGFVLREKRKRVAKRIATEQCLRVGRWLLFADGAKDRGHELISDVADAAREIDPAACVAGFRFVTDRDGIWTEFSLRSCGALDVSAIAKANGGGGHSAAAGFSVNGWGHPIAAFERALRRVGEPRSPE